MSFFQSNLPEEDDSEELSYGQKAAGVSFNPSNDPVVADLKQLSADFINYCDTVRNNSDNPEVKRMASVAITEAQTAQMWAVKAATWEN